MKKKNSSQKTKREAIVHLPSTLAESPQVCNRLGDTGGISVAWSTAKELKQDASERTSKSTQTRIVTWVMKTARARITKRALVEVAEEDREIVSLCSEEAEIVRNIVE